LEPVGQLPEPLRKLIPTGLKRAAVETLAGSPIPKILATATGGRAWLEGCEFLVTDSSVPDSRSFALVFLGIHEASERRLALRHFEESLPVIDIGAGIGVCGITVARSKRTELYVGVEPNRAAYGLLRRNLAINRVRGLAINAALWYDPRANPTFDHTLSEWTVATPKSWDVSERSYSSSRGTVSPTTLSSIVERLLGPEEPFQLLCDIEGFEWELIANEGELLQRRCKRMVVEFHEPIGGLDRLGESPEITDISRIAELAQRTLQAWRFETVQFESVVGAFENTYLA
jgi:FkbM family methyltransferase